MSLHDEIQEEITSVERRCLIRGFMIGTLLGMALAFGAVLLVILCGGGM